MGPHPQQQGLKAALGFRVGLRAGDRDISGSLTSGSNAAVFGLGLDILVKPDFQKEYVQLEVCKYTSGWECKGTVHGSGEMRKTTKTLATITLTPLPMPG